MAGTEFVFEEQGEPLEYLKAGFYWQQVERQFHRESLFFNVPANGPASPLSTQIVDTEDEVNVYEWQVVSRINVAENHLLTTGIDIGYDTSRLPETQTNTVVTNPFGGILAGPAPGTLINPTVVGSSTTSNLLRADAEQVRFGVFLQDQWTIGDFELTPGVRFDYFSVSDDPTGSDESDWGFSGSLAGVYRATETTSIYSNLATGFRVPDMGERFQDAIVNIGGPSRVLGNPSLDPERSWSAEIGAKHEGDALSLRTALFYNLVENYITDNTSLGTVGGFSTSQFDNVGTVSLYGVEIEAAYNITPDWQILGNASRTYTNDSNEVNVTDWVFNYGTSYRLNVQNYGIDSIEPTLLARTVLDTSNSAGPGANSFPEEDGFTVLDFQIVLNTMETKYGQTKIIGGMHNLTNEEYFEPFFTTLQPERSFYVSVEHKF